jgi:hypothetical protein
VEGRVKVFRLAGRTCACGVPGPACADRRRRHVLAHVHVHARCRPARAARSASITTPRCARAALDTSSGLKRTADEFFADTPERVWVLYANGYSCGYFRKQ